MNFNIFEITLALVNILFDKIKEKLITYEEVGEPQGNASQSPCEAFI